MNYFTCRMLSAVLLLTVVGLGSSLPQLNIPANDNIFRSFPVASGGGVQGEVTSIAVVEVRAEYCTVHTIIQLPPPIPMN